MAKIIETIIDRFDGGITSAIRSKDFRFSRIIKHFDVLSTKGRMLPNISHKSDVVSTDSIANDKLCMFLSYGISQSATNQYALGVESGSTDVRIYKRASIPSGDWAGQASVGVAANQRLFVEYKGDIYAAVAGTHIAKYNISGNSWSATDLAVTYTNTAQGLVHSKDDRLYIALDNKIYRKTNETTWDSGNPVLTLPTNLIITSICEYGNALAIATQPLFIGGHSIVYIWNRDSSLSTLDEKIDWGTENLQFIEEIEGFLIGVSTTVATNVVVNPKILFKYYAGASGAKQFFELTTTSIAINFGNAKQKANNRLYFMMGCEINSVWQQGIWTLGRNEDGVFCLSLAHLLDNDTVPTSSDVLLGFQLLGDYLTLAYIVGGTTYTLIRTNEATTYTASSIYESLILNFGDSEITKKLLRVIVMTEPMPADGQVVMKYKKDEETSWTTIFTSTSNNSISHYAINIESSGVTLPEFKEIQFQILSTGKATITGLKIEAEIIGSKANT